jgi:hypothetical protein
MRVAAEREIHLHLTSKFGHGGLLGPRRLKNTAGQAAYGPTEEVEDREAVEARSR